MSIAAAAVVAGALLSAFGAAAISVDREELQLRAERGSRRARSLARAFAESGARLSEVRFATVLCALVVGALVEPFVDAVAGAPGAPMTDPARGWVVAASFLLGAGAQVVVGEMVGRSVGSQRPMGTLMAVGEPAAAVTAVLSPVVSAADQLAQRVVGRLGAERSAVLSRMRSRKELIRLVQLSERSGTIRPSDADLLERTLRFGEKRAEDVLTPRVEVQALPATGTVGDLIDLSGQTGISRFPVYGTDLDDIVGIVHVKDVLGLPAERRRDTPLVELMRPVLAVPESKLLESLMVELRDADGQFALVVDEYGGTAGIVTLEDLIEEIVGDISDEHDPALSEPAVRRWAGAHVVAGSLHPDEVADACGFEVPAGDYETLAGFVMAELGRVPEPGDGFTHDGWELEVLEMDGNRIRTVKVVAPSPGAVGDLAADPSDGEPDAR